MMMCSGVAAAFLKGNCRLQPMLGGWAATSQLLSCSQHMMSSNTSETNKQTKKSLVDCPTAPAWDYDPRSSKTLGGDADFGFNRKKRKFYVDHTRFLGPLGDFEHSVFFRPSRFGKTHWLSVMEHYYGILHKNQFESTFQGLAILKDEQRDKSLESSFYVLNVSLPANFTPNYEEFFEECVNRDIENFVKRHNNTAADLHLGNVKELINPHRSSTSLTAVASAVEDCHGRLMVLVDEYDRAPLVALSSGKDMHDTKAYEQAVAPLRSFLGTLKGLGRMGNRYFVTGITPVAMAGLSIWNDATDLTHNQLFASMLGLTEAEVQATLVNVAGIGDEEELQAAMEVVKTCYNGYHFSNTSEDLYNPQLVLYFATNYQAEFKREICETTTIRSIRSFSDPFQSLSSAQANLLSNRPDMARALVCDERTFITEVDQSLRVSKMKTDPHSYLYYAGILTHADKNASAIRRPSKLCIPNLVTCQNFAEEYVNLMYGTEGSAQRFVETPTIENLKALCEITQLKMKNKLDPQRTEADFQAMLMWPLFSTTNVIAVTQRRTPNQSYERQDILLHTPKERIVLELKSVPLRKLTNDPVCWPMNPRQPNYQEECTRAEETLLSLSEKDLLSLPGVHEKHQEAQNQASRYLSRYSEEENNSVSSELPPIIAFAVTEVGNCRYLVDEVSLPNLNP